VRVPCVYSFLVSMCEVLNEVFGYVVNFFFCIGARRVKCDVIKESLAFVVVEKVLN